MSYSCCNIDVNWLHTIFVLDAVCFMLIFFFLIECCFAAQITAVVFLLRFGSIKHNLVFAYKKEIASSLLELQVSLSQS